MREHEHRWAFDGDDPYIVCRCGEVRDALTGRVIRSSTPSRLEAELAAVQDQRDKAVTDGSLWRGKAGELSAENVRLRDQLQAARDVIDAVRAELWYGGIPAGERAVRALKLLALAA